MASRLVSRTSKLIQTTNSFVARSLAGCPNYAWYLIAPVLGQVISPVHTINVAHLT